MSGRTSTTRPAPSVGPPSRLPQSTRSGGQALDRHTQAQMSSSFGHDFSAVRVHTDAQASRSAQHLGAAAFAQGADIVFGEGQYTPGSPATERLLAHELTHVVQQVQGGTGDGLVSRPGDASEREADSAADSVLAGESVSVQAAPTAVLSRSFLDGEDPENDFWGTKSNLGNRWGGTADAAMSSFWDGAGLIPGISTGMGALSTGIDVLKATGSGAMSAFMGLEAGAERFTGMGSGMQASLASERYGKAASRFSHDAEWDALGMVPGLGTVMSAASLGYDGAATIDRASGHAGDNPPPMMGDHWDRAVQGGEHLLGL